MTFNQGQIQAVGPWRMQDECISGGERATQQVCGSPGRSPNHDTGAKEGMAPRGMEAAS